MRERVTESRMAWLVGGVLVGLAVALYWPSEPAYAVSVSRADKFSLCSVSTQVGTSDAVFVLDFVTGRLVGAAFNSQGGAFTEFYLREIAADFDVQAGSEAEYVFVPANAQFNAPAGAGNAGTPAQGAIYVGELNSGRVVMYGFMYRSAPRPGPVQPLAKMAQFSFRESFGD